jgi:predicted MPP superfamily phosphohydrolase
MKMTFRNMIAWLIVAASISACGSQKVSFAVMSDVHLMGDNPQQIRNIDSIIFLANNAKKIIGDSVGKSVRKPFGLFVTGDLTDSGTPEAWNEFEEKFGLNGDGRLEMPVYETFGNHDGDLMFSSQVLRREKREQENYCSSM